MLRFLGILTVIFVLQILSSCESSPEYVDMKTMDDRVGLHYAPDQVAPFTGKAAGYFGDGKLHRRIDFLNGKEHGPTMSWYQNGKVESEGRYTDGLSDSLWTWYDRDGNKRVQVTFDLGKKVGVEMQWYPNGQEKFLTSYSKDGKQNGTHSGWYENGQIKFTTSYNNGLRDSLYVAWYESGQKRSEATYQSGQIVGTVTQWQENGRVKSKWEYEKGKPVHNLQ